MNGNLLSEKGSVEEVCVDLGHSGRGSKHLYRNNSKKRVWQVEEMMSCLIWLLLQLSLLKTEAKE